MLRDIMLRDIMLRDIMLRDIMLRNIMLRNIPRAFKAFCKRFKPETKHIRNTRSSMDKRGLQDNVFITTQGAPDAEPKGKVKNPILPLQGNRINVEHLLPESLATIRGAGGDLGSEETQKALAEQAENAELDEGVRKQGKLVLAAAKAISSVIMHRKAYREESMKRRAQTMKAKKKARKENLKKRCLALMEELKRQAKSPDYDSSDDGSSSDDDN